VLDDFQLLERASRTAWWDAFRPWPSYEGLAYYWLAPLGTNPAREPAYFRPLEQLIYWANYGLWGMRPLAYHLAGLALHLTIALLVFRVARRFTRRLAFAGLAGLLFAVHPAHAEAVQWVAALSDPLVTLFALLAFDAWFTPGGGGRARALGFYGLALLCKESAVTLPVLLLLGCLLLPGEGVTGAGGFRQRLRTAMRALVPFWALTAAYLALHVASTSGLVQSRAGSSYLHSVTEPGFAAFALFDLAVYLWNLLVPLPLFPLDVRDLIPGTGWILLLSAALLGLLGLVARRALRGLPGAAFFALWPVVTLLPVLPVVPGQRFLYLPSVGFCWAAALVLERAWERRAAVRRRLPLLAAVVGAAGIGLANLYQSFWGIPGNRTRELVRDVQRWAPALPPGSEIYLVNLWAPAVRLPDALRLEYGDPRLQVRILSCSPKILPIQEDRPLTPLEHLFARYVPSQCGPSSGRALWLDDGRLQLSLAGERYGHTLVEEMLPTRSDLRPGMVVPAEGFQARVLAGDAEGVQAVEFTFDPLPPGAAQWFFEYRNGHLRPMRGP
jgi:hypothetical protein